RPRRARPARAVAVPAVPPVRARVRGRGGGRPPPLLLRVPLHPPPGSAGGAPRRLADPAPRSGPVGALPAPGAAPARTRSRAVRAPRPRAHGRSGRRAEGQPLGGPVRAAHPAGRRVGAVPPLPPVPLVPLRPTGEGGRGLRDRGRPHPPVLERALV